MQLLNVKLLTPGWETFSGDFCGWEFADGVTVSPVPRNIADKMASILLVETEDLDGNTQGQGGVAARLAGSRGVAAGDEGPLARMTDDEHAAENKKVLDDAGVAAARVFYTEDELNAVADEGGIEALRVIAKPWNVKDRQISKLVMLIIKAQDAYHARVKELEDEQRAVRAKAGDEAIRLQLEQEAKIAAAARVLADDKTPNAIGPDGKAIYVAQKAGGTPVPDNEFKAADETAPASTEPPADPAPEQTAETEPTEPTEPAEAPVETPAEPPADDVPNDPVDETAPVAEGQG